MGISGSVDTRENSGLLLEAPPLAAERVAVRRLQGETVTLGQSAVLGALGKDVTLSQSAGLFVSGAKVTTERSATQWLVGGLVQAKQVFAVTVIAAKVEGQVK